MNFRKHLKPSDRAAIEHAVTASGFFTPAEIAVALELADDASGHYQFIVAEEDGRFLGYSCHGHISVTESAYDLYWIVVDPALQGKGAGRALIGETICAIREKGGTRMYAETSSQALYEPTREFYARTGFVLEATVRDFYKAGDHKLIYSHALTLPAKT